MKMTVKTLMKNIDVRRMSLSHACYTYTREIICIK